MGPGILRTADCRKTCKELEERGVELTQQPYERVYALMWRLIEAAIGQESDRKLAGTVEVDEVYVSCGSGRQRRPGDYPTPV